MTGNHKQVFCQKQKLNTITLILVDDLVPFSCDKYITLLVCFHEIRAMIVLTHCSLIVMMWTNNEEQFLLDDLVPFELY